MTDRIGELYDAHAARLYAYARRHADAEEAEDLVAEAFTVAIRRLGPGRDLRVGDHAGRGRRRGPGRRTG